jgi:hypothetical protein
MEKLCFFFFKCVNNIWIYITVPVDLPLQIWFRFSSVFVPKFLGNKIWIYLQCNNINIDIKENAKRRQKERNWKYAIGSQGWNDL